MGSDISIGGDHLPRRRDILACTCYEVPL